ncbi:hypothetical protein ACFOVU_14520 [Nocardiopsis sediminis]|uniref:Uncharacterized protein n=1 Tax=Nocardiopsis sediminis TaxID=1778267 RepID=A0ABV8FP22_9ACTN
MSDLFELTLVLDLALSDAEAAELRWHLGQGPRPEGPAALTVPPAPARDGDDLRPADADTALASDDAFYPALDQRGLAARIGGHLFADLEPRGDGTWSLMCRQEVHPDAGEAIDPLVHGLAARAVGGDTERTIGYLRFHEDIHIGSAIIVRAGRPGLRPCGPRARGRDGREPGGIRPFSVFPAEIIP